MACDCDTCHVKRLLDVADPAAPQAVVDNAVTTLTLVLAGLLARSPATTTQTTVERLLELRNEDRHPPPSVATMRVAGHG